MMARRVGSARSFNVSAAASNSAPDGSETTFADTQIVCPSRPAHGKATRDRLLSGRSVTSPNVAE